MNAIEEIIKLCGGKIIWKTEDGEWYANCYIFEAFDKKITVALCRGGKGDRYYEASCKGFCARNDESLERALLMLLSLIFKTEKKDKIDLKQAIIDKTLELAEQTHYSTITRAQIAKALSITQSLIFYYWGPIEDLRDAMLKLAIKRKNLTIIAQIITFKNYNISAVPEYLILLALEHAAKNIEKK